MGTREQTELSKISALKQEKGSLRPACAAWERADFYLTDTLSRSSSVSDRINSVGFVIPIIQERGNRHLSVPENFYEFPAMTVRCGPP